jgi:hypothetical protein
MDGWMDGWTYVRTDDCRAKGLLAESSEQPVAVQQCMSVSLQHALQAPRRLSDVQ